MSVQRLPRMAVDYAAKLRQAMDKQPRADRPIELDRATVVALYALLRDVARDTHSIPDEVPE